MKSINQIVKALSSLTQVSLTIITPVGICLWFGNFLVNRYLFPQFTIVISIILGIASGFYGVIKYFKAVTKEDK